MNFKKFTNFALAVVVMIPASFLLGRQRGKSEALRDFKPQIDTIYRSDTITALKPVYLTKRTTDTMLIPVTDTVWMTDTLFVKLPREEKVYEDSTYRAVVSGYHPSLDTISVFQKSVTIKETVTIPKTAHWGIGIQAGAGIGKGGVSPYVGVGVSYNFFTFGK